MASRLYPRIRLVAALAVCCCLCALCVPWTIFARETQASPAFRFHVDESNLPEITGASGDLLTVRRDAYLPVGESIRLGGWLATAEGVAEYRYMWVPAGGGYAAWQRFSEENCTIGARGDLTNAQIPYASGHGTAGYRLTIPTPEGLTDGYYDLYIRAIDGAGAPCDMLALLHLRYGNADAEDTGTRVINFDRLLADAEEDASVFRNGANVRNGELYLPDGGTVRLGDLSMGVYEALEVAYHTVSGEPLPTDRRAVLGLKSSDRHPFTVPGTAGYNLTDTLAYSLPTAAQGMLTLDLTACTEEGTVWLTASLPEPIVITNISFVKNGNSTDRVAAKIQLSESLLPHFAGPNAVNLSGVQDPVMGDVLRVEVAQDTNDPFVHFYAEQVLETADIRLSADTYKYMVVLARSMPHNQGRHTAFYLCAGMITGATGDCTYSFLAENDGEWHYYLLDLSEVALWTGLIHGWRFDIINGNCRAGDAMDFASVQFFRTREAAEAAAGRPTSESTPYHVGDAPVILDMVEEQNGTGTLDPEETYILPDPALEPETVPTAESDTLPESAPAVETLPSASETTPTTEAETAAESAAESDSPHAPTTDAASTPDPTGGCASAMPATALLLWVAASATACLSARTTQKKRAWESES